MKSWTVEKKAWIIVVDDLFEQMFGSDFLTYCYDKDHGTKVKDELVAAVLEYRHEHWESHYSTKDSLEPQEDTKHLCYPRTKSGIDMQQPEPRQHPAPKHAKCNHSLSKPMTENPPLKPKLKAAVVIEDEGDFTTSQQTNLQLAMAKVCTTRAEVAALYSLIPPLTSKSPLTLKPVYGKPSSSDPFSLGERPCESDIQRAQKMLNDKRKAGKNPTGIEIQGEGQFSENALSTLKRYCNIADTHRKVSAEARWLLQMKCSPRDMVQLQNTLWHHPASSPILKYGKKGLDATSFSDLVEERYIDSFVIDICISKFLDESRVNGKSVTVYLPTEFYDWMSSGDKKFQQLQLREKVEQLANGDDLQQILVPVYMPNHWGLIFVDLASQEIYFDDGLMSAVTPIALPCVKQSLELLVEMYPNHPALQSKFWQNCSRFQRFGMPSQTPVDSKMIGTGSCGIGVIMAARDIINNGPSSINNFQWRYCDMDFHRKDLMLQILKWSGLV